jgi:YD repeat-containing protein
MKSIFIWTFIFSSFLIKVCQSQEISQLDFKKIKLKGDVESITTNMFELEENFGMLEKNKFLAEEKYFFNNLGFIEKHIWQENGSEVICNFTYDEDNGNLLSEKCEPGQTIIFSYDEDSKIKEKIIYNDDGNLDVKIQYTYDKKKRKIEEHCFSGSTGDLYKKLYFLYDNFGNLIEEISHFPDPITGVYFKKRNLFSYDRLGNKIKESEVEQYSTFILKTPKYYRVAFKDWPIDIKNKYYSGIKWRTKYKQIYKYDKQLLISQGFDSIFFLKYYYNEFGDISSIVNEKTNIEEIFSYLYDEFGNWIEKTSYKKNKYSNIIINNTSNTVQERIIVYRNDKSLNDSNKEIFESNSEEKIEFIDEDFGINKNKDSVYELIDSSSLNLIFEVPSSSLPNSGGCKVILKIKNNLISAFEYCEGVDTSNFELMADKKIIFKLKFIENNMYKISEILQKNWSSVECEYIQIKDKTLYLYDKNFNVVRSWFCLYGNILKKNCSEVICPCIFLPYSNNK